MTRPIALHNEGLPESAALLTLPEAASELRCSRAHLYRAMRGRFNLPPLPVFHIGRRALIRRSALTGWIRGLEAREREDAYASGLYGVRDDELEFIAGA